MSEMGKTDADRVKCSNCGKPVSSPVPEGTVVRAWVECPECVESSGKRDDEAVLREAFQAGVEAAMDFTGEHIGPDDDAFDRWLANREDPSP